MKHLIMITGLIACGEKETTVEVAEPVVQEVTTQETEKEVSQTTEVVTEIKAVEETVTIEEDQGGSEE